MAHTIWFYLHLPRAISIAACHLFIFGMTTITGATTAVEPRRRTRQRERFTGTTFLIIRFQRVMVMRLFTRLSVWGALGLSSLISVPNGRRIMKRIRPPKQ